MEHDR